jgi:hypothetical protein
MPPEPIAFGRKLRAADLSGELTAGHGRRTIASLATTGGRWKRGLAILGVLGLSLSSSASSAGAPKESRPPGAARQLSVAIRDKGKTISEGLLIGAGKAARFAGGKADHAADVCEEHGRALSERKDARRYLGKAIQSAGRAFRLVAGTNTLLNTSVEFGGGLLFENNMTLGGLLKSFSEANIHVGMNIWTGSINSYEKHQKDRHIDIDASVNTAWGGFGKTLAYGKYGYLNAGAFMGGFVSERSYSLSVGIPNHFYLLIGEVHDVTQPDGTVLPGRGPFVGYSVGNNLFGLSRLATLGYGLEVNLFSPALEPITKCMRGPTKAILDFGARWQTPLADRLGRIKQSAKERMAKLLD